MVELDTIEPLQANERVAWSQTCGNVYEESCNSKYENEPLIISCAVLSSSI